MKLFNSIRLFFSATMVLLSVAMTVATAIKAAQWESYMTGFIAITILMILLLVCNIREQIKNKSL